MPASARLTKPGFHVPIGTGVSKDIYVDTRVLIDRHGSGEQRFVYANPVAWDAMTHGVTDYPDGAVFAKIGVMTREDPGFTSSKIPSGPARIQFMVRNKAKYAETDGWGYALFSPAGPRLSAEPVPQQSAACHEIVPDRGYVFSQPVDLLRYFAPAKPPSASNMPVAQMTYSDVPATKLPPSLRQLLSPSAKTVRSLSGPLQQSLFIGTMNEITPSLIKEADRSGKPAMLMKNDGYQIVIVAAAKDYASRKDMDGFACPANQKKYASMQFLRMQTLPLPKDLPSSITVNMRLFCNP